MTTTMIATTSMASSSASPTPTIDSQNFQNNLFTDLAPLLALFGAEATKQFLATSMGWADSALLGIAPLGMMTIITSAIRIGRSKFLKAIIGRSRESVDEVENELLSSTSTNVQEIWDGQRIVRQVGESKCVELAYQSDPTQRKTRLHALSYFKPYRYRHFGSKRILGALRDSQAPLIVEDGLEVFGPNGERAANLTQNMPKAVPAAQTVKAALFAGIFLQLGVMAINGITVYLLHWQRAGKGVAVYGYPTWAAGTLALTIGMFMLGHIIERSSVKYTIEYGQDNDVSMKATRRSNFRIIRFQKKIPSLGLPAFIVQDSDKDPTLRDVHVSLRKWPPQRADWETNHLIVERRRRLICTWAGIILTLSGFICQNIGSRELHWSAAALQLFLTLFLTMIRAYVRRHIGDVPRFQPVALGRETESCQLANTLEGFSCSIVGLTASKNRGLSQPWKLATPPASLRPRKDAKVCDGPFYTKLGSVIPVSTLIDSVENIVETQICLNDIEPANELLSKRTDSLCDAILHASEAIFGDQGPAKKSDQLSIHPWVQFLMLKYNNPTQHTFVYPCEMPGAFEKSFGVSLQALMELSFFELSQCLSSPYNFYALQILGNFNSAERDTYQTLLQAWVGPTRILDWDHLGDIAEWRSSGPSMVLGWAFGINCAASSRPASTTAVDCCLDLRASSLEEAIAIDLFSSFMLGAAKHGRAALQRYIMAEWERLRSTGRYSSRTQSLFFQAMAQTGNHTSFDCYWHTDACATTRYLASSGPRPITVRTGRVTRRYK